MQPKLRILHYFSSVAYLLFPLTLLAERSSINDSTDSLRSEISPTDNLNASLTRLSGAP
jgi:uncharacterized Fe-S cluster-containing MiaB family protein